MLELNLEAAKPIYEAFIRKEKDKKDKKSERKVPKKRPQVICPKIDSSFSIEGPQRKHGAASIIRELYKRDKQRRLKPKWMR